MNYNTTYVIFAFLITILLAQIFSILQNIQLQQTQNKTGEIFQETVYNAIENYFDENTFEVIE